MKTPMKTGNQLKLATARQNVKVLKNQLFVARETVKNLRNVIKSDRLTTREATKGAREAKREAAAQKRKDRITKLEAKLVELRLRAMTPKALKRANRKASKPVNVNVTANA